MSEPIDRGPEPASPKWHYGETLISAPDWINHVESTDARAVVHRVTNWHAVCDRVEVAEAKLAEAARLVRSWSHLTSVDGKAFADQLAEVIDPG